MKFTNPIRDYKHLLVNRIINSMIDLRKLIDNTDYKIFPQEYDEEETNEEGD